MKYMTFFTQRNQILDTYTIKSWNGLSADAKRAPSLQSFESYL